MPDKDPGPFKLTAATRWGVNVVLLLAGIMALYLGRPILIPTVIALLLASLLWPAAEWLNRTLRLPWGLACSVVVGALVGLALLIPLGIGLAVPKMLQTLPSTPERQEAAYQEFRSRLEKISPVPLDEDYFPKEAEKSKVFLYIKGAIDPERPYILSGLLQLSGYGINWLWHWILIMFILLFLLLEGRMLSRRVVEIFGPSAEAQAKAVEALRDMAEQIRTYLVWRTLVNFGLGLIVGLVYQWMGLGQPWTWAILTAIFCYVPYLGPIAAGIPPVIDAFITCPTPWYAVAVLIFYIVVINIEGYIIVPVVMGRPMQLNATTVILSCLLWERVWGTPGLFLAMPLMAAVKAICTHVPGWEAWANLMSTRTTKVNSEAPATVPGRATALRISSTVEKG